MEPAISVKNLSKSYKMYPSPKERLKELVHPFGKKYHKDFWALRDVNLEIPKGTTFGIVGQNGSGKSTLLQLICGILQPTSGSVQVNGRISALLELGAGFNRDFTGRENVFIQGAIMGIEKKEMEERFERIADFADIGHFIDQPVKTYSSGMYVRLAFASAINVDPDILIVDEALAVGDIRFQQKCYRKINEFREMGKTIIFVTHSMSIVKNYCNTAIWIRDGFVYQQGDTEEVVKDFTSFMFYGQVSAEDSDKAKDRSDIGRQSAAISWDAVGKCSSFGDGGAVITKVAFYKHKPFEKATVLKGGEKVSFMFTIDARENIAEPIAGFIVTDKFGNNITGTNTFILGRPIKNLGKGESVVVEFEFTFPKIMNGTYMFSPAIAEGTQENHIQHHWVHDACVVQVLNEAEASRLGWYIILDDMQVKLSGQSDNI